MMNHVFVVLHYKTAEDTHECIESILAVNNSNKIVVVDNGSGDNSGNKLKNAYSNIKNIHFIILEKNIGFASANNLGYDYAKNKLHADFIEVCNNDIVIESNNFLNLIENKYNDEKYYIAGPNLYNEIGRQQPLYIRCLSQTEIIKKVILYRIGIILCGIGFYGLLSNKSKKRVEKQNEAEPSIGNTFLQGSFIIYSPLWIERENFAFYPGTFLYLEELLLKEYCKSKDYKYSYILDANVFHKGGSSTSEVYRDSKDKYVVCLKHSIKSLKTYLRMIGNK